ERGVSILREAQYHALTCHEEQHEGEHHGAGRARRAAAVAEIHVDHHDERGEHRGRGKNTGESAGSFRPCTGRRCGKVSQLLASDQVRSPRNRIANPLRSSAWMRGLRASSAPVSNSTPSSSSTMQSSATYA